MFVGRLVDGIRELLTDFLILESPQTSCPGTLV